MSESGFLVLNGKEVSQAKRAEIAAQVRSFTQSRGRAPGLAVILVGQDPASQVYVRNKGKACEEVGIKSTQIDLDETITAQELRNQIDQFNADEDVDGILVQLPLPKHLNSDEVLSWIDPRKDPDALTTENIGLAWAGKTRVSSCTPSGVMQILKHYNIGVAGKKAVVIGRSNIVGKPMAQLLLDANATVTICHSRTDDLKHHTTDADIVVAAAGKPRFLGKEYFKKGAVVIDVGIHREQVDGKPKLCGDVKFEELEGHAMAATPVPGGVGPMTITMLLYNTLKLAEASAE